MSHALGVVDCRSISRCLARSSCPSTGSSTSPRSTAVELGAYDVGVGLELAVGEVGIGVTALEEAVAQVVGVDRA